jgi:hypothetical protein
MASQVICMTVTDQSGRSAFSALQDQLLRAPIPKRRVFISYHHGDGIEATNFVSTFGGPLGVFTHRALGLDFDDDLINSNDPDYVMRRIREEYLADSTVTIVLIGTCTHSRRFVDWEIKASLQQGSKTPNGLLGILLPSAHRPNRLGVPEFPNLPNRFNENLTTGYASYNYYPTDPAVLRGWIEHAFLARTGSPNLIRNGAPMMCNNRKCLNCWVTH